MVDVFMADQLTSQVMNLAQVNYINYFQLGDYHHCHWDLNISYNICLYGNLDPITEAHGVCFLLLLNEKLQDPRVPCLHL